MVGDGSSPPEKLLGEACVPENPITQRKIDNLESSELITHRNFHELVKFVDGPLEEGGYIIVSPDDEPEDLPLTALENQRSKLHQHLHNYLASVYSFNEQVRELINLTMGDPDNSTNPLQIGAFVPNTRTLYTRKLAFIRGLRVDAQHGDFACIRSDPVPQPDCSIASGDETAYRITFDKDSFRDGFINNPDKYLGHEPDERFEYPLAYIELFHRSYFVEFSSETREWLEEGIEA